MPKIETTCPGVVVDGEIYHLDEFLQRVRWSKHAWRQAKRNGLNAIYTGGRAYVRGTDFANYLESIDKRGV